MELGEIFTASLPAIEVVHYDQRLIWFPLIILWISGTLCTLQAHPESLQRLGVLQSERWMAVVDQACASIRAYVLAHE